MGTSPGEHPGGFIPKFYGEDLERMTNPAPHRYASPMDRQTPAGSGHRIDQTSQFIETDDRPSGMGESLEHLQKTLHSLEAEVRTIECRLFGNQPVAIPQEADADCRPDGAAAQVRVARETAQRVQGWLMKIRERL